MFISKKQPGIKAVVSFLFPSLLIIIVLFFGGLFFGFLQSLGYLPSAGMSELGFRHYQNVLGDPDFLESLGLTFYISIVSTVIACLISLFSAVILNKITFKPVHFIFRLPLIAPHLTAAAACVFLLSPTGFISRLVTATGLIDGSGDFPLLVNDEWCIGIILVYIWKEVPFITLMILSALKKEARELEMVGMTLKADRYQRFFYITLPIIFPSMAAGCLIVFAFTFGAFETPFLLGKTYPLSLPVLAYKYYSDVDLISRPEGIATGLIIALVVIISALVSERILRMAAR